MLPQFPNIENPLIRMPFAELVPIVQLDETTCASLRLTCFGDPVFVLHPEDHPGPVTKVKPIHLDQSYVRYCNTVAMGGISDRFVFVENGFISLDGSAWIQGGLPVYITKALIPILEQSYAILNGHSISSLLSLASKAHKKFIMAHKDQCRKKRMFTENAARNAIGIETIKDSEIERFVDKSIKHFDQQYETALAAKKCDIGTQLTIFTFYTDLVSQLVKSANSDQEITLALNEELAIYSLNQMRK